jgi:hypothetical protein
MDPRLIANLYGRHRRLPDEKKALPRPPAGRDRLAKAMPYRLQVETTVKRQDLVTLRKSGPELVRLIEGAGLPLLHSAWEVGNDVVRLFNWWHMGHDADSLTIAELKLPDIPAYARFDRLIIDEVKNISIPVARGSRRVPLDPQLRYVYLHASYRVPTPRLAEFAARLESSVIPFGRDHGWMFGDAFLGITGLAGTVVQLWAIPEHASAIAPQQLAATDWHELLAQTPVYRTLEPAPSDPSLGLSRGRERSLLPPDPPQPPRGQRPPAPEAYLDETPVSDDTVVKTNRAWAALNSARQAAKK